MKKFKIGVCFLLLIAIIAVTWAFVSTQNIVVLNPKGMIGIKQRDLLVKATWLMMIVVIPVYVLTLFFAWRYVRVFTLQDDEAGLHLLAPHQ